MVLNVGEQVMEDKHGAYYTEDFTIHTSTLLAKYVKTNNTGLALCGSYSDEYIGDITTNTVFKISPNVNKADWINGTDNKIFGTAAVFDSISIIMTPSGYVYGDSSQTMNLAIHEVTQKYELDTIHEIVNGVTSVSYQLNNNSAISYALAPLVQFSFTPEQLGDDNLEVPLSAAFGQNLFDKIVNENPYYVIDESGSDNDQVFVDTILYGLTIRNDGINNAIIGFKMPTSTNDESSPITLRLYYHNNAGIVTPLYHDFVIYDPNYHFNQVSADFSTGLLNGITPGGGISSKQTNGLTFIQAGLGLMTHVSIPDLNSLNYWGDNMTILDLDLDFSNYPNSTNDNHPLPTYLQVNKFQIDSVINPSVLADLSSNEVGISLTQFTELQSTYSIPITGYGYEEQATWNANDYESNTLLLRAPNTSAVSRMVIGDGEKTDCNMLVKMYYTKFDN